MNPAGTSSHGPAMLSGRYWPTGPVHIDTPRLPDGTVDIRALCRLYDDLMNGVVK